MKLGTVSLLGRRPSPPGSLAGLALPFVTLLRLLLLAPPAAAAAGPDLVIAPDYFNPIVVERAYAPEDCEVIEGCAVPGLRRYLVFGTETRNIGDTDLFLGDPARNTNFTFIACHGHYHFQAFADYRLVDSSRLGVANGTKVGFCLQDIARWDPNAAPDPRYDCEHQGIQRGWSDIYEADLPCQWIDITGVPAGRYVLEVEVNPEGRLIETTRANNITRASLVLDDACDQPPTNDLFASATVLPHRVGTAFASTRCAGREESEPEHAESPTWNTIWFRWQAPATGEVEMSTEGSPYDTLLVVYSGTELGTLSRVADNNDDGPRRTSRVHFTATAGTVYHAAVAGLNSGTGAVAFHVNPGGNDDFLQAQELRGRVGHVAGVNSRASSEPGEPPILGQAGEGSVWFRWRAPATTAVQWDTGGSNFDTLLAVYTGPAWGGLTPVAADADSGPRRTSRVRFEALAGTEYWIVVAGAPGQAGFFQLNWAHLRPHLLATPSTETGVIQVTLEGLAPQAYDILRSDDLAFWDLWTRVTNLTGSIQLQDPLPPGPGQRFYRAVQTP